MIPNTDERIARQLHAAYELILSWPVRDEKLPSAQVEASRQDGEGDDLETLQQDQSDT
jgi:hypothetical protein